MVTQRNAEGLNRNSQVRKWREGVLPNKVGPISKPAEFQARLCSVWPREVSCRRKGSGTGCETAVESCSMPVAADWLLTVHYFRESFIPL